MLVSGLWSMELVVDGVMLRTGKPYTPNIHRMLGIIPYVRSLCKPGNVKV